MKVKETKIKVAKVAVTVCAVVMTLPLTACNIFGSGNTSIEQGSSVGKFKEVTKVPVSTPTEQIEDNCTIPGYPTPPRGYKETYCHNFAIGGIGDWFVYSNSGKGVSEEISPVNGLGITLTSSDNQYIGLRPTNGNFGPGAFIQALLYLAPTVSGEIANWPSFWSIGNSPGPVSADGEIDFVEGLGGRAAWHVHSPAGGPGSHAHENQFSGWVVVSALWEKGKVTFWYNNQKMGTEQLTTTQQQKLQFTSTTDPWGCYECEGPPSFPNTNYLKEVEIYRGVSK